MMNEAKPLEGNRIGFLGKGGAGKSTVLVLMARELSRRGYQVCVLDADSTNIGLHQALGLTKAPTPLVDYFGGMVFSGGLITCPVDDPTPLRDAAIRLDAMPPQYIGHAPVDDIFLLLAGKLGEKGPGAGCDGPLIKIARDLTVNGFDHKSVTLIDFKAGFEDSARGAIITLDEIVVVADPTRASLGMVEHLIALVDQIKAGGLPATEHLERLELVEIANRLYKESKIKRVSVVLNKIPDAETEGYMLEKLSEIGVAPIGVIHEDPHLAKAWLRGEALSGGADPIGYEVSALVDAMEGVDTPVFAH